GQKKYVDEYLAHKVRYLSGIDLLYFVIDIQDSLRFDEAFKFLEEVLAFFKEMKTFIPIMILYHKFDPKLKEDLTIVNNRLRLQKMLKPLEKDFEIHFYETSIFDVKSIIHAISKGIYFLYDHTIAIQKFVDELVQKMDNVMALLIFEQNGIELGSYFLDHITLNKKLKILTLYEISQKRIIDENLNTFEFSDRLDPFTKISGTIQSFMIEGLRFFILLILEEHEEKVIIDQFNYFEKSHEEFHEILKAILLDDYPVDQALNPS
ncbi:MAG: hypothetical protein ACTSVZ_11475, partial [Promethearchaeota archaeon]